jgi:hypothetical protein
MVSIIGLRNQEFPAIKAKQQPANDHLGLRLGKSSLLKRWGHPVFDWTVMLGV